jgi:hypothetical protein
MRQELQQKLYDKYPKIFRQKDLDMKSTCMCWGIEVGDGWYQLIDSLCSTIQNQCDNSGVQTEALQVKEKFGTLRFYITCWDDYIYGAIDMAEKMSSHICENCGAVGKIRGASWLVTLCDKCEEQKNDRKRTN